MINDLPDDMKETNSTQKNEKTAKHQKESVIPKEEEALDEKKELAVRLSQFFSGPIPGIMI